MAYLEFRNISIAGISAGVPKHVKKTVSTTSKYEAESFIESTGVKEKDIQTILLLLIYVKQRRNVYWMT